MSVKAKFRVNSVEDFGTQKEVKMTAVYGTEGENASYSKYTPSGQFTMRIDKDTSAFDYFQPGDEHYLTFEKAEKPS